MINNHPDQDTWEYEPSSPSRGLAPSASPVVPRRQGLPIAPVRPKTQGDQASSVSSAMADSVGRLGALWRKDASYKVLMIAIVVVVIVSIIFVSLGRTVLAGNDSSSSALTYAQNPPTPVPSGTVDLKPSFPNPVSG